MFVPPHPIIHLPMSVVHGVIRGVHIATIAQYLSAAGLVALLYDHFLTLGDEINSIWTAPRSFMKWTFLTNHYLVEACLIAIANATSGYSTLLRDDQRRRCRAFVIAIACYSMISTFVANMLGFLRVINLWDKSPRIMVGLSIALTLSFLTSVAGTVASIIVFKPEVKYDPILNICYLAKSATPFIVLWAIPLAFDITVVALILYNSLSNPRGLETPLRRILHRDGILFFLLVTFIRALNLIFAIVTEPGFAAIPAYFSWAVITLACRRLLIHIRSCEQESTHYSDLYMYRDSRHSSIKSESEFAIELHGYKADRY